MKNTKIMALVALGLVAGLSAKATYYYNINASDASSATVGGGTLTLDMGSSTGLSSGTFTLGTTPTSTSVIDVTGSGVLSDFSAYTTVNGVTSTSFTGAELSANEVAEVIKFTITGGAAGDQYLLKTYLPLTGAANSPAVARLGGSNGFYSINVTAAPEPAQTLAGAMLLGCGGLIFASRRMFSKKSV